MGAVYEVKDFEAQVLDGSANKPVIVDFWADWCGPCHMLEPIITELAAEHIHAWTLVKVNVDENEEIADQYNIKSIPTICIFDNGEVIARYSGLMYKPELKKWIDSNLPNEMLSKLNHIKELINNGATDLSREELESLVKEAPENNEARTLLACEIVLEDPKRAVSLLENVQEDSPFFIYADSIRTINELHQLAEKPDGLPEGSYRKDLLNAISYIEKKQLSPALEILVEIIMHDKGELKEIARKAGIAVFTILGHDHPTTNEYRKRFDMALY